MPGGNRYEIEHVSRYLYSQPVRQCSMSLCLRPSERMGQRLLSFSVRTEPVAALSVETDAFGNTKHLMHVHGEHDSLVIAARFVVETAAPSPLPETLADGAWESIAAWKDSLEYWDLTRPSTYVRPSPALNEYVTRHGIARRPDPLSSLLTLNETIFHSFDYEPGATSAISPIEHILETGRGVCQDYAHVMISIARSWGVPTRYVSGFVASSDDRGSIAKQSATHAWVECLLPGIGWTGFDPTNRDLAGVHHVRVATGRDYRDVSPTRGIFVGGGHSLLEVTVTMRTSTT